MSDNRDFARLSQNPTSTEAVNAFDDLASEVDGAFSASLTVAVTDTNTVTITRAQLTSVTRIVLQEGSPVTTDTITVFVNNDNSESPAVGVPLGRFTVINETANSATFLLTGGSSPSGTDLIAAGVGTAGGAAAALIDVLDDDVVSVGGGSGGGGAAAPVDSVFGRTGVVVAQAGDYDAPKIAFTDPIAGSPPLDNVDEALVYLLNNMGGGGGGSAAFSGALVYNSTSLSAADYTSGAILTWSDEEYDTDGFHSTVSDTSRLTIPSGVSWAKFYAQIRLENFTIDKFIRQLLVKNGSVITGPPRATTFVSGQTTSGLYVPFVAAPIAVTPGDYFELRLVLETDTSVVVHADSYFAVEVVA